MKLKGIFCFLILAIAIWSCKKDDGGSLDPVSVPEKTLAEANVENDSAIKAFLESHFYNYQDFETPPDDFDYKIVIAKIEGDNSGKTPLIDQVEKETIIIETTDEEIGNVSAILYYLIVRQGVGASPTIGDNSIVHYEGLFLDQMLFDGSTSPAKFYLSNVVRGFGTGVTKLASGVGPFENGDGTVSYNDYGIGMIIMPSTLGYFDRPPSGSNIPNYSPLVFKVDMLEFEENTDFDNDGIPSIMEDLNMNGLLSDDNTDLDTETSIFLPNHLDADDDNDGTLTREEIIINADGTLSFPDSDGDGTPDYLDSDS